MPIDFPSSPVNGQQYQFNAITYQYDSSIPGWLALPTLPGGVPAGTIVQWVTNTAPANWLICDGSAISRANYASLFQVIGTTYGSGDGSTTFNLPDLRGRIPVGKNSGTFSTLAGTGGAEVLPKYGAGTATGYGLFYSSSMDTADTTGSKLPPYIVLNYIIKSSMANTPGDSALATRVGALEYFNTQVQAVPVGGTGAGSFTAGSYLKGNGTAAIQAQAGIPATDITSGALAIARGGTGGTTGAGIYPMVPSSIAVATGTGSFDSTTGLVTFSGVTSVSLNGVFSTTYRGYKILVNFPSSSASTYIWMKFRTAGTDNSAGQYFTELVKAYGSNSTTGFFGTNANNSGFIINSLSQSYGANGFSTIEVYEPASTLKTNGILSAITNDAGFYTGISGGLVYDNGVAFDGLTIYPTSGTMGGTMTVYGYR